MFEVFKIFMFSELLEISINLKSFRLFMISESLFSMTLMVSRFLKQIKIFVVVNLIFHVENLIFHDENLIFHDENLIFMLKILFFC